MVRELVLACLVLTAACTSTSEKAPERTDVHAANLELARQIVDARDYRRAIQYLMPLHKREPSNRGVLNLLGTAYLGMGNADAARETFAKLVEGDGSDDDAKISLSYAQILSKQTANARQTLMPLIDAKSYAYPERAETNMGLAWMEDDRCDKAVPWFRKALGSDPTMVPAHFNLGRCYAKQGKWKLAAQSYKRAVDFCPGCVEPVLELVQAQVRTGEYGAAAAGLEKLLAGRLQPVEQERARKLLSEVKRR